MFSIAPSRALASLAAVVLVALAAPLALPPDCAHACSCGGGGAPFQVLAKGTDSAAVFSGEVLDVEEGPPVKMFGESFPSNRITLRVSEVWKGPRRETLEVSTPIDGALCGYHFEEGQEYLVYAYGKEEPFEVDLCSQTRQLSKAGEHLRVLGDGRRPGDEPLPDTSGGVPEPGAAALAGVVALATAALLLSIGLLKRRRDRAPDS